MIPYSELRSQPRMELADQIPLDVPLSVFIEPTNICNLRCNFCAHTFDDYGKRAGYHQHMKIDLFRKVIEEVREMKLKSLKLYFFGEPMLHPNLGEICSLAVSACERVELTTNGMLMTPAKAQAMIDAGLHYLRVSFYSDIPHPENVVENVRMLRKLRDQQGRSLPRICVKAFTPGEAAMIRPWYENVADEIIHDGLHSMGSDLVLIHPNQGKQKACPYPFYTLVVKANGDVVPCCVAWETSLVYGNVGQNTIREIWHGEKLKNIQRMHLEGRAGELAACNQCDTIYFSPDNIDSLTVEEFDRRTA
jgi:radical SAM protein with 4Fe4S-binding SPASM domain